MGVGQSAEEYGVLCGDFGKRFLVAGRSKAYTSPVIRYWSPGHYRGLAC
jgi:hypothetical protein